MDLLEIIVKVGLFMVPFLFALCFHEFAHGWMAQRLGDNTAQYMGRLTLNPMAHADPLGTFFLPIASIIFQTNAFFGWAKPVPVNSRNFKHEVNDMFWVAAAGPLSNLLLAIVGSFAYAFVAIKFGANGAVFEMLKTFLGVNLSLAFFNLLPLHPLDGGKILARFLPRDVNEKLEANQHISSMVLLAIAVTGGLQFLSTPIVVTAEILIGIAVKAVAVIL